MPSYPPGTRRVDVYIPPALAGRLEALLQSEALGRIPRGSLNAFFVARLAEFLGQSRLPLGLYEGFGPGDWVSGPAESVRALAKVLEDRRRAPEGLDEAFPELNPLASREGK